MREFGLGRKIVGAMLVTAVSAAACSQSSFARESDSLKNKTILIIRHAEKEHQGSGLSDEGNARAEAYIAYFKTLEIDGKPLKLNYIFAAKNSKNSSRPHLTIEPTAQALGVIVNTDYKSKQYSELVREIKTLPSDTTILVSLHHSDIAKMLLELGADPETVLRNGKWPGDVYGWLIELRFDGNGMLSESKRINESLLPDDSNEHSIAPP